MKGEPCAKVAKMLQNSINSIGLKK